MKRIDFADFFTYTNPLFWIFAGLAYAIYGLKKVWLYTTIPDWFIYFFRLGTWSDESLNRLIKMKDKRPDKLKWYWKHKDFVWKIGSQKAKAILEKRLGL